MHPGDRRGCVAGGLLALVAGSDPAWAHAIVVHSAPAAGETVALPPSQVMVRFNGRIDHKRSVLSLGQSDKKAHTLAILGDAPANELRAPLAAVPPGAYRLQWQVLSVDGHITRGVISFTVGTP
ncbi:MAG: copper resistance protein CopC [Alphaproteobacteria bacterium]|nr:copper resistance protein CopC [Alphaproteobacteria bacterium]